MYNNQNNPHIQGDFPLIFILVYLINWIVWFRILNEIWLSLGVSSVIYLMGFIVYVIFRR